jgi:arginyl-tRNA synthetase
MPDGVDPLEWGYSYALEDQRRVLAEVGIEFDVWFSENALVQDGAIEATVAELERRGAIDQRDGATWLETSRFGDDKDRVMVKSDGEYTYFTPDIAYHRNKFERGFDLLINVWGADHHGYIARMKAAMEALGHAPDQLQVELTQLVKLLRDGDEVGADAARITYLLQSIDTPQTVDLAAVAAQSMDNPVYYIQMAHTRLCSIARTAEERGIPMRPLAEVDLGLLTHPREAEAMRALFDLPDVMALAAREREPHRLTTWLRETAGAVHGWYHDCPVLSPDVADDLRQARLWLAEGLRIGLRVGLDVIGVSAPESM